MSNRIFILIMLSIVPAASLRAQDAVAPPSPAVQQETAPAAEDKKAPQADAAAAPVSQAEQKTAPAAAAPKTGEKPAANTASSKENPVDENALFGGETVTDSKNVISNAVTSAIDNKFLSFTGSLMSRNNYIMTRYWMSGGDDGETDFAKSNSFNAWFEANFNLDIRLYTGVKAFINASLNYYATPAIDPGSGTEQDANDVEYPLEEIFIDINVKKYVYFRIGKQFVQWGTGYFWNPTDVINLDRRSFLNQYQIREGVYGLKMMVPVGTRFNFYAFLNFYDAQDIDNIGISGKAEVLIGNTEMALSATYRKDTHPVIGYEITSRLFTIDLRGELSVSPGTNGKVMDLHDDGWGTIETNPDGWTTQICLGLGRGFDVLNVKDRIRLDFEFFYNHSGYSENIFEDANRLTKATFIAEGCWVPNYYGRFYTGVFMTVSQLGTSTLSANLNWIFNCEDLSNMISAIITWRPLYNLELSFGLNGFPGPDKREYTFLGAALQTELNVRVVF